jgi:hypothetical protein
MGSYISLLLTLALASSTPSYPQVAGIQVAGVHFKSNVPVPEAVLRDCADELRSRHFDGADWPDEARERAKFCFQKYGFFKVELEVKPQSLPEKHGTHRYNLVFAVSPGQEYKLGQISFQGEHLFSDSELRPLFSGKQGEVFNREKIADGLDKMRQLYSRNGYINFTPVPETTVDDTQSVINLQISIDEGRQYRVQGIIFSGVSRQDAERLSDRLELKVGDVFNGTKITEFFDRNRRLLPKHASPENSLLMERTDQKGLVYLKFDLVPNGYLR